eukprot:CAMPEP_0185035562 /NCGR_PEP_ID=MMETSP1103-20130426/27167_1 /TAXON_ID=36769 /ORGANISM="Paraphysomonas bandaiensis, Strain Caron Lab Isolate" /LENGTH=612 /DNA_ID=CAMNT_0027572701 /DNA_START=432 /DNA_END=2270 /DNA_ORIENTATION=-
MPELTSFCCSGVGGFRAALLSGRASDKDLDIIFTRSRSYIFVDVKGVVLLNPRSTVFLCWQTVNLFCTVLCSMFVPVEVAFSFQELGMWTQILGAFFEVFFMLDIVCNLNLPVYDKHNSRIIGDRAIIRKEYMKFWFWVDAISCLPLDILELCLGEGTVHVMLDIFRIVRVLKISKLIRLLRADLLVVAIQDYISLSHVEIQLMKLLFLVVMTIHFMACGLFVIAALEETQTNWMEENHILVAVAATKYACAVYWATMTATTIGYGDIEMVTPFERSYSTICMVIGASVYAFITSRLVGMLLRSSSKGSIPSTTSSDPLEDFESIIRGLSELPVVHRAVLTDYLANREVNRVNDGTKDLLKVLSPKLRALLGRTFYRTMVNRVPLLCPPGCSGATLDSICGEVALCLQYDTYMPGEIIVTVEHSLGEISRRKRLSIVDRGSVLVHKKNMIRTLHRYQYFGEETILLRNESVKYRQISSSTSSYCGLYILTTHAVDDLLTKFPVLKKNFQRYRVKLAFRIGVVKAIRRIRRCMAIENGRFSEVSELDSTNIDLSRKNTVPETISNMSNGGLSSTEDVRELIDEVKTLRLKVSSLLHTLTERELSLAGNDSDST